MSPSSLFLLYQQHIQVLFLLWLLVKSKTFAFFLSGRTTNTLSSPLLPPSLVKQFKALLLLWMSHPPKRNVTWTDSSIALPHLSHALLILANLHPNIYRGNVSSAALSECIIMLNEALVLFLQPRVWEKKEGDTCEGVWQSVCNRRWGGGEHVRTQLQPRYI